MGANRHIAERDELIPLRTEGSYTRRDFLRLLGVGGVAALPGCFKSPRERVEPFVRDVPGLVPGEPLHYATALPVRQGASGLIVCAREGRPIKVEGNPHHPASLGSAGLWEQASLLGLYDPQRAKTAFERGRPAALDRFRERLSALFVELTGRRGEGLHLLLGPSTSPLLADVLARLRDRFPALTTHFFDPLSTPGLASATRAAFGEPLRVRADLREADVIASLDDDFLGQGPERLLLAKQWSDRRVPSAPMNRLYVAECARSLAGCVADHRLGLRSSEMHTLALALIAELRATGVEGLPPVGAVSLDEPQRNWTRVLAKDLAKSRGRSAVLVGEHQPEAVHLLGLIINEALGNLGRTVLPTPSFEVAPAGGGEVLETLAADAHAGRVRALLIDAFDPVYAAPLDLDLGGALSSVPLVFQRSLHRDETSAFAHWFAPASHPLESWGDVRSADGTVSIIQPLISPLYDSLTTEEFLSALLDPPGRSGHELLTRSWSARVGTDFDAFWRHALRSGVAIKGPEKVARQLRVQPQALSNALKPPSILSGIEVNFRPDIKVCAGEFGHNAWLQECPDPVTQVTWDNPVQLGPETARKLGVSTHSELEVRIGEQIFLASVFVVPGHAEGAVTLALGYGQKLLDSTEAPIGANAHHLRSAGVSFVSANTVCATGGRRDLALIQITTSDQARPIAIASDLTRLPDELKELAERRQELPTLYKTYEETGYRWGMAIDLSRCMGCQACVVACQSENNVPVVGREEVSRGREMHWLRVDTYYATTPEEPEVSFHPLACVHCENAPCEYVCPVNATVHSEEGLNEMVYNRCVGTRYCSNNCPYKVRRFNWRSYNEHIPAVEQLSKNPEVTVRARGVMEKCTYCVQRIERARIQSRLERRNIRDGEIVTACAQACPTHAIVFGTLSDNQAEVSRLHHDPRRYDLLHELGTRPHTAYLARVTHKNPELG
jgi:molybdopterin-containing oxidoreductase family iron-sulfur binding subunit